MRFVRRGPFEPAEYDVVVDGNALGYVCKRVERYNLRRPITVVSWEAFRFTGTSFDVRIGSFRTRRMAAEQIVEESSGR